MVANSVPKDYSNSVRVRSEQGLVKTYMTGKTIEMENTKLNEKRSRFS